MKLPIALLALLLAAPFAGVSACGDDEPPPGPRCGDGICSPGEDETTCPRDCPSHCAPDLSETPSGRCVGNTFLVCTEDGRHEISHPCQPGEYCAPEGCQPSEGS